MEGRYEALRRAGPTRWRKAALHGVYLKSFTAEWTAVATPSPRQTSFRNAALTNAEEPNLAGSDIGVNAPVTATFWSWMVLTLAEISDEFA